VAEPVSDSYVLQRLSNGQNVATRGSKSMAVGKLRIYLGAAPGVGKTFAMLGEGRRRRERGTDVVIGFAECYGRPKTMAETRDLEVVPSRVVDHRGRKGEEMDLDAILARKPAVALVDELAHTNRPGSLHKKRWQDVARLLDAGIDVISTVSIDQIESLSEVVQRITTIHQREMIPDEVVRRAEQIELVDMSPEALRRRIAHGNIYPPEKIDTALNGYFRAGNLGALRVLALLWLADRVEEGLHDREGGHARLGSTRRPGSSYHPTVLVMIEEFTRAVVTALEYSRMLRPERLSGLHVDTDQDATLQLAQDWYQHFRARVPLIVVEPSGRSVPESCVRTVRENLPSPEHPVVVIVPRRSRRRPALLERDPIADKIAAELSDVDDVFVLFAPDFSDDS
jgi:K+-sensing histidine kinase KdpD